MFENCRTALCPSRYEHASTVKTTAFFVVGESVEYENAASARKRGGRAAIRAALLAIAFALYVCGAGAVRRIGRAAALVHLGAGSWGMLDSFWQRGAAWKKKETSASLPDAL